MTRVVTTTAVATPIPVRTVMWQTYDDGGWKALDDARFAKAKRYFTLAQGYTTHFPADDYHHGRTETGLAWGEYRLAKREADSKQSVDPEAMYRGLALKTSQAIAKLANNDLSESERPYLAKAHHLLGLLQIQLCDGLAAAASLSAAEQIYRAYQERELRDAYFEVLQLKAKLRQCRREFAEASGIFRTIMDEAPDVERRFSALLDLANTLTWMGYVREAWQLRIQWKRLATQLESRTTNRPDDEITRGQLVFARIHMLYGQYAAAEELLRSTCERLRCSSDSSAICWSVYWILSAEVALQLGNLSRVDTCLKEYQRIVHQIKLSEKGYGCLEIVAIDAACQVCILETCSYEIIRREYRCICGCWRVVFVPTIVTETITKREPINFAAILAEIANGIRAGVEFHKGRYTASDVLVRDSIAGIQSFLHTQTPLLIPLQLLRANVMQAIKESPVKYRQQLNAANDIVVAIHASPHPYAAERDRLIANWYVQLDQNELATNLYARSLQHSANFRSEMHPEHLMTLMQYEAATGTVSVGTDDDSTELPKSQEAIWSLVEKIKSIISCHDYRVGMAITNPIWLCFYSGCVASAQRGFRRVFNYWTDRNGAIGLELPDTRQADALLGLLLTSIEMDTPPEALDFAAYRNLATREVSSPMIAFELNHVGMLMMRAGLFRAAKYSFDRSIEIYASQDYSGYHPTAHENLATLASLSDEPKICP
ncbi:hypothetical protein RMSM_05400 [Rhodopirellula maiorica SM1]|uniref:Uncharacterized protein n=1 Tax=Rhodopirellula maiorica SM1 TaxID=1265738 RepID=M5RUN3_9BACT|nr:hypothetical protein [Rhodopirellula maiorica]EMI17674.1 hypothetical protein RMSM_05400 [Rhodopirellula maiorica SM1]